MIISCQTEPHTITFLTRYLCRINHYKDFFLGVLIHTMETVISEEKKQSKL